MARGYPRFLFSDPQNVKTPGPFIVHLLEPRIIFRVSRRQDNSIELELLDKNVDEFEAAEIKSHAFRWLINQLYSEDINYAKFS